MPTKYSPDVPMDEFGDVPDSTINIPELDKILGGTLAGRPGQAPGQEAGGPPTLTPVSGNSIPPGSPMTTVQALQNAGANPQMAPPPGMPNMGGMMPPGMNPDLKPGGPSPMGPGLEIASKLGKPQRDPEAQAINLITTSIDKLNQLGDLLMASDEASAKSVRQMIRILGDILKSAEHGKAKPLPPL